MFENLVFKEGYTIKDFEKEKRVVFFDIDSTLGGNTSRHGIYHFKSLLESKRKEFEEFKKEHDVYFSFADYIAVDQPCLAMFMRTLMDTNSVAFCVSSWMVSCSSRAKKANMNPLHLMELVFKKSFPEWQDGIIVGGFSRDPSSRGEFCKKASEHFGFEYFVIDDSGHKYTITENLINVDGDCGYQYKNHKEITNKWEIEK